MKTIKLAILTLMTIISTTVNSQNKAFATYTNGFGKSYDITVTGKDTSKYDIRIDAHSMDVSHKIGGIMVRSKSENKFIIALTEAKAKYAEFYRDWETVSHHRIVTGKHRDWETS